MARKKLGEILIQAGVIDESKLKAALAEQARWGGPLGRILVDMRVISEDALVQALSHQLNFPAVKIDEKRIPEEALSLVPVELCEQHGLIPFALSGKFLDVAMADPTNLGIIDELRIRTRLNVRAYLAGPKSIERAVMMNYRGQPLPGRQGEAHIEGLQVLDLEEDAGASRAAPRRDPFLGTAPSEEPGSDSVPAVPAPPSLINAPFPTPSGLPPIPAPAAGSPAARGGRPAVGPPPATMPPGAFAMPPAPHPPKPPTGSSKAARLGSGTPLYLAPLTPEGAEGGEQRQEIAALQQRVQQLEALVARDEDVIRKLMGLLIQKGICTREEIVERIK